MNDTYAYFAVTGDGPHEEITNYLGCSPTKAFSKGDPRPRVGIYTFTKWCLHSRLPRDVPIHDGMENHVIDVIDQVLAFKEKLGMLRQRNTLTITCVAMYHGANPGFVFGSELINRVSGLNLGLEFDIYSLPDEENA